MRTKEELKLLCESRNILTTDLSEEEVLALDLSDAHPQVALQFVIKYGKVINKLAKVDVDEIIKALDV